MKEINWYRLVVVTAVNGEKFIGFLPKDMTREDLFDQASGLRPVELTDVRQLVGQMTSKADGRGQIVGVQTFMTLLPYDIFESAAPCVPVIMSSWYFPGDYDYTKKRVEELFQTAERNEIVNQATRAGLEVAGPLPRIPRPPSNE